MKHSIKATLLSLAILSSHAWAEEKDAAATPAAAVPAVSAATDEAKKDSAATPEVAAPAGRQDKLFNISRQGYEAMYEIQRARLSLFSGYPEEAVKAVDHAVTLLSIDQEDWKEFVKTSKKSPRNDYDYIVIDAEVAVAENYVSTPDKQQAIDKANEKFKKGDHRGAIEALRLAGVGVSETEFLMPLKHTLQAAKDAQSLLKAGKYYEANLALKGAEEGIISDTETISEMPEAEAAADAGDASKK